LAAARIFRASRDFRQLKSISAKNPPEKLADFLD
jgi:hypothetical protein